MKTDGPVPMKLSQETMARLDDIVRQLHALSREAVALGEEVAFALVVCSNADPEKFSLATNLASLDSAREFLGDFVGSEQIGFNPTQVPS